jgi:hypothetical protein
MPFTPLHFGPGLALKAVAPRISFTVFMFSQVLIDLEPLFFMVMGEWHLHRFFHTYLGAVLIVFISVVVGRPLCCWFKAFWNVRLSLEQASWFSVPVDISWSSAILGAMAGAYSHILLDSVMHSDIVPFSPFFTANGLYSIISVTYLKLLCLVLGFVGLLAVVRRRLSESAKNQ